MGRRLRYVPPGGSLVEVSSRTFQGRFLLRPSRELNEIVVRVLTRALELWPVRLHGVAFLSNHFHLLLSVSDARQLSGFVGYFKGQLAKEAGRLHGWEGKFWSRRFDSALVTGEATAQISRLRYLLAQGTKEGLVASPLDWPGVHSAQAFAPSPRPGGRFLLETSEGSLEPGRLRRQIASTALPKSSQGISLSPLPCWAHLCVEEQRRRAANLVKAIEVESGQERLERGAAVLGAEQVLRQNPHARARVLGSLPAPQVHAATRAARAAFRDGYALFVEAYRRAARRFRAGDLGARFPEGCFPPAPPFVGRGSPDLVPEFA